MIEAGVTFEKERVTFQAMHYKDKAHKLFEPWTSRTFEPWKNEPHEFLDVEA